MKCFEQYEIDISSKLNIETERAWECATDMKEMNKEFFPFAYMSYPKSKRKLEEHAVIGEKLFRSWIFAFYIIPIDWYDVTFQIFDKAKRFVEISPIFSQRSWRHERIFEDHENGCILRDIVRFKPRVKPLGYLFYLIYRLTFYLRHYNLKRLHGEAHD